MNTREELKNLSLSELTAKVVSSKKASSGIENFIRHNDEVFNKMANRIAGDLSYTIQLATHALLDFLTDKENSGFFEIHQYHGKYVLRHYAENDTFDYSIAVTENKVLSIMVCYGMEQYNQLVGEVCNCFTNQPLVEKLTDFLSTRFPDRINLSLDVETPFGDITLPTTNG